MNYDFNITVALETGLGPKVIKLMTWIAVAVGVLLTMPAHAQAPQLTLDAIWVEAPDKRAVKLVAKVSRELGDCLPLVRLESGLFGPSCIEPEVIGEASGLTIVCSEFRKISIELNLAEREATSAVFNNWMRERVVRISSPSGAREFKNGSFSVSESRYDGNYHITISGFVEDLSVLLARLTKNTQPTLSVGGRRYVLVPHRGLPDVFQIFSQKCAPK